MPRGYELQPMGTSGQQARMDTTAILLAILLEKTTGDPQTKINTMNDLFDDPERMGAVVLTLAHLVANYANMSGLRPNGLQQLCDYLLKQLKAGTN